MTTFDQRIEKTDQTVPRFVMETVGSFPGLPIVCTFRACSVLRSGSIPN